MTPFHHLLDLLGTIPDPRRAQRRMYRYIHAFETGSEARAGIGRWIDYYNADRPHSALGGRTPNEAYQRKPENEKLAA